MLVLCNLLKRNTHLFLKNYSGIFHLPDDGDGEPLNRGLVTAGLTVVLNAIFFGTADAEGAVRDL